MSILLKYLICAAIGAAIFFLCLKGCNKSSDDTKSLKTGLSVANHITDSLNILVSKVSHRNDSILIKSHQDSAKYSHKIDSQSRIIAILTGRFANTKDSISTLYDNLKVFYLNHDTASLRATYENLHQQLVDANNELFAIQIARDSADNIRNSEILRLNLVITQAQAALQDFKVAYTREVINSQSLGAELEKSIKQQKRAKVLGVIEKIGLAVGGFVVGKKL
jgi:hypothetical protein